MKLSGGVSILPLRVGDFAAVPSGSPLDPSSRYRNGRIGYFIAMRCTVPTLPLLVVTATIELATSRFPRPGSPQIRCWK